MGVFGMSDKSICPNCKNELNTDNPSKGKLYLNTFCYVCFRI